MKKRIISMITAIMMIVGILPLSVGAATYNENLFSDGACDGEIGFEYDYINFGNIVIKPSKYAAAPASEKELKTKQEVTQHTAEDGNKYIGIRTDKNSDGGQMVEFDLITYSGKCEALEENTLYKFSMRIKVPEASIKGASGKAMAIPNKVADAYNPILCDRFGIPTTMYENGNIADKKNEFTKWEGYYQTLTADEWTTLETYYRIKEVDNRAAGAVNTVSILLRVDSNRIKDFEYYVDDFRLEAVENTIEPLEIKSADGNDKFEVTIPKFNEPDAVSKYCVEYRINGTEIYNDEKWGLAALKLPEGNNYKGVSIRNNELIVSSDAVNSTILLTAEAINGAKVEKEVRLVSQTQLPEVRNLNILKENGYLKANYDFYDPMGGEDKSVFQWYYMDNEEAAPVLLDGAAEKNLKPDDSLHDKLFMVKITPKTEKSEAAAVASEIIPYLDLPPVANNVKISGIVMEGSQIRADYEYFDVNKDAEGETEILWYMSDSLDGAFDEQIGSGKTLELTKEHINKYIRVSVKPVSVNAPFEGEIVTCTTQKPVERKNLLGYGEFEDGEIETIAKQVRVSENGQWVMKDSFYGTYSYDGKLMAQCEAGLYSLDSDSHSGNQSLRFIPQTGTNASYYYADNIEFSYDTFYVATAYVKSGQEGYKGKATFHASNFQRAPSAKEIHYRQDLYDAGIGDNYYFVTNYGTNFSDEKWQKIQSVFYIQDTDKTYNDKVKAKFTLGSQGQNSAAGHGEVLIDDVTLYEPNVDMEIKGADKITIPLSENKTSTAEYSLNVNLDTDGGISFVDPVKHIKIKNDTDNDGVSIENNILTVSSDAKEGIVTLQAVRSGVTEEFDVRLVFEGSDEERTRAQSISLTKSDESENTVDASYKYYDADGIAEGATEYQWMLGEAYDGEYTEIENANSLSYTAADLSKFYKLRINVRNTDGRGKAFYSKPFSFSEAKPVVTNVAIAGKSNIDEKLTLAYTLEDPNGSNEMTAEVKWYRSADGSAWQQIDGAADSTYWPVAEDLNKHIRAGVTPSKTELTGDEVYSNVIGPIEKTAVDFIFVFGQSNSADAAFRGERNEKVYLPPEHTLYTWQYPIVRKNLDIGYSWTGAGLLAITDKNGNDLGEWAEVNDTGMFGVPLCTRWSELSGKKVVYFNAGIPGAGFGDLGRGMNGYNAAVAGIKKAYEEIEARGYTIDKKLMFWLQGESDAGPTYSKAYTESFTEMKNGFDEELGGFDLTGMLVVRGWMSDCFHNTKWDLYLTGSRAAQYAMNNADNDIRLVSIVTERMTNDKDLEEYMLEKYPNPISFKEKFKYDRPTDVSRQIVHSLLGSNDGHYVEQGKLLIGVDAAENAYRILFGNDKAATDIRVLNQYGVQQKNGDEIDLTGKKTYIAVTAMPLYTDERVSVTLSDNIKGLVEYNELDGSLTQIKESNVEYGTITFKTADVTKTLKVKLKTDGYPLKFGWDFDEHDPIIYSKNNTDYKVGLARYMANRGNGYSDNRMMGQNNGIFEDGYYLPQTGKKMSACKFQIPIIVDTTKSFAFKFNGIMDSNTNANDFGRSALLFSEFIDLWGAKCSQAIRIKDTRLVLCEYDYLKEAETELKSVDLNEFCDDTVTTAADVRGTEAEWEIGLENGVLYAERNGKRVNFEGDGQLPEVLTIEGMFNDTMSKLDYVDIIYDYNDVIEHNVEYDNGNAIWDISNYTGSKQPYSLLFGVYENGTDKLVKTVVADEAEVDYAGERSGTTKIAFDADTQYVKSFFWENMQSIKPIKEVSKALQKPIAYNVRIISSSDGEPLIGEYDYFDKNRDDEGDSIYKWYVSDSKDGGFEEYAAGKSFKVSADILNKYIKLGVTPVSVNEPCVGDEVFSEVIGPVAVGYSLGVTDTGTERFLDVKFDNPFGLNAEAVAIEDYLPRIEYYNSENELLKTEDFKSGSYDYKGQKKSFLINQPENTEYMNIYLYSASDSEKQLCDMYCYRNIMRFKGMTASFLGDSITYGIGVAASNNRYDNRIAEKLGLKAVYNYGVSGTRIARQNGDVSNFNTRAESMNDNSDLIIVFGGTNDYGHGIAPFGTLGDTGIDTYCGAVDSLMRTLKNKYPNKKIVFMTPARRIGDENPSTEYGKTDGKPLRDYCEVIIEKGKQYDIPVLDLYNNLGINPNNPEDKAMYTTDGLHFNDAGHEKIASLLLDFIKNL